MQTDELVQVLKITGLLDPPWQCKQVMCSM